MGPLALDETLGLETIESLQAALTKHLSSRSAIELDAAAVETIDTAAIQLLAAFAGKVEDSGQTIRWLNTPEVVRTSARLLGLERQLGL